MATVPRTERGRELMVWMNSSFFSCFEMKLTKSRMLDRSVNVSMRPLPTRPAHLLCGPIANKRKKKYKSEAYSSRTNKGEVATSAEAAHGWSARGALREVGQTSVLATPNHIPITCLQSLLL